MRDKYTFKQVDDERTSVTAICIFHLNCGHYQLKPTPTSSISTAPASAILAFKSVQWQG